jgi:hypothetical protein
MSNNNNLTEEENKYAELEAKAKAELGEERFKQLQDEQDYLYNTRPLPTTETPFVPNDTENLEIIVRQLEWRADKGDTVAVDRLLKLHESKGIDSKIVRKYEAQDKALTRRVTLEEQRDDSKVCHECGD